MESGSEIDRWMGQGMRLCIGQIAYAHRLALAVGVAGR